MSSRTLFPADSSGRKAIPVADFLREYFPLAIIAMTRHSVKANEKHNPGQALHWSRHKSSDHANCIVRHQMESDGFATDPDTGELIEVAVAWRACAQAQIAEENRIMREAARENIEKMIRLSERDADAKPATYDPACTAPGCELCSAPDDLAEAGGACNAGSPSLLPQTDFQGKPWRDPVVVPPPPVNKPLASYANEKAPPPSLADLDQRDRFPPPVLLEVPPQPRPGCDAPRLRGKMRL
jgi:hypothetical protein